MNELFLALDLWVGAEFWLPAGVLILVSLMVIGSPTAQLRTVALSAVFVAITIFAVMAQQWLIALVAMFYPWMLIREAQRKSDSPIHILPPAIPRPWRAIALICAAMFVGIWVLAVKRTAVWHYAENPISCSFNNVLSVIPSHTLTLSLIGVALMLAMTSSSKKQNPLSESPHEPQGDA